MKVFKFGGASIHNVERMINTAGIISDHAEDRLLIVVSAMGKTTNALEKVVDSFCSGNADDAILLFNKIKNNHLDILKYLNLKNWKKAELQLSDFFTEAEWLLHDKPVRPYDYYYDQLVCLGEMLSSTLLYHLLLDKGISVGWADARDIIRTDNNFRDAGIDWKITSDKSNHVFPALFEKNKVVITQGFIGSTDENESTTLGREGSDYTAAIFANILDADSLSIWKDVEAVMSADPRLYPSATNIESLSYAEVIEMAYYGAQVIHPKTIKPLQNKSIPLYVKSFLNPELPGTSISTKGQKKLPPIIVYKSNQVMMKFKTRDFSFMSEAPIQSLHQLFHSARLKPNITQIAAISMLVCLDDKTEKITQIANEAALDFDVELQKDLSLLTIRHYDEATIQELTRDCKILLEQKTTDTIQIVYT